MESQNMTQNTYKHEDFEFAGLAYDKEGMISMPSLIDLVITCLAASKNAQVTDILQANGICVKDVSGKIFFPPAQKPK